MPNTFQRPMFMSFCPPFTEAYLQEEKDDTDEHTCLLYTSDAADE